MNEIELNVMDIYDILYDCGLMTMYSKEYGEREVLDEDMIIEDFVPMLIDYINSKIDTNLSIKIG